MTDYFLEPASPTLSHLQIDLFPITVPPDGRGTPAHMHPAVEMLYFVSGSCVIRAGNEYKEARAGDLAIFRGNTVHGVSLASEDSSLYHVLMIHPSLVFSAFSGLDARYPMSFLSAHDGNTTVLSAPLLCGETRNILDAMLPLSVAQHDKHDLSSLRYPRLRAKTADLLTSLLQNELRGELPDAKKALPDEALVKQIYESLLYIDDHFAEALSPLDCAEKLHMSYSYYAKRFSQVTGRSFKQYLFDCRMSHAENMLLASDLPVTEIAIRCGYSSVSHFISEFRRYKGVPPLHFRKNMTDG